MRILVLGATGYVGSRLVPALLAAGHDVVAASSSPPDPDRFSWGSEVTWRQCDVASEDDVAQALVGVEGVCYLVHSMSGRDFARLDLLGAQVVRRAVDAAGVERLVYLSGLVPDVPREELSAHLASRLEVEEVLLGARASTLALRAGVVIGAGSTSFEVVRQLGSLLVVQPIPGWMRTKVQPIAVTDAVRALVEAFDGSSTLTGAVDIGGPDVVPYPRLLASHSRASRLLRVRVPALVAPPLLVAIGTAGLVRAPFWTVTALVDSLRHDMVCRAGATWEPASGPPLMTVREAMTRAVGGVGLEGPLPSDPHWTRQQAPLLDALRAPRSLRAGVSLLQYRLRDLRGD